MSRSDDREVRGRGPKPSPNGEVPPVTVYPIGPASSRRPQQCSWGTTSLQDAVALAFDECFTRMHVLEGCSSAVQVAATNQQRRAGIPAVMPVSQESPDEREHPPIDRLHSSVRHSTDSDWRTRRLDVAVAPSGGQRNEANALVRILISGPWMRRSGQVASRWPGQVSPAAAAGAGGGGRRTCTCSRIPLPSNRYARMPRRRLSRACGHDDAGRSSLMPGAIVCVVRGPALPGSQGCCGTCAPPPRSRIRGSG